MKVVVEVYEVNILLECELLTKWTQSSSLCRRNLEPTALWTQRIVADDERLHALHLWFIAKVDPPDQERTVKSCEGDERSVCFNPLQNGMPTFFVFFRP